MVSMYFIAFVAPADINRQVLNWKQFMQEHFGCTVALRSPAHITLIPPFWMDEALEKDLEATISEFSKGQTGFKIDLKDFSAFKPKVIYVDVPKNEFLQTLHPQLQNFLAGSEKYPVKIEERSFHPHVTIAGRDLHKKDFYKAWEIFKEKKYKAAWNINGVSLLKHNQKNWDVIFTSQFQK
jgi:2'-5' RNA ligase